MNKKPLLMCSIFLLCNCTNNSLSSEDTAPCTSTYSVNFIQKEVKSLVLDENYLLIGYRFNEETMKSSEARFVDVEVINKKIINQRFEETANIVYPDGEYKDNYSTSNFCYYNENLNYYPILDMSKTYDFYSACRNNKVKKSITKKYIFWIN